MCIYNTSRSTCTRVIERVCTILGVVFHTLFFITPISQPSCVTFSKQGPAGAHHLKLGAISTQHIGRSLHKICPSVQYLFGRRLSCRWRFSLPRLPLHRHKCRQNLEASHPRRDLGPRHLSTSPRLCAPSPFSTRQMNHRSRSPPLPDRGSFQNSVLD